MSTTYNSTRVEGPITGFYGKQWLLVWNMDANGSIYSMARPTIVSKEAAGCSGYTYAQVTAYNSAWSEIMLTSYLHPEVRWVFSRNLNAANQGNIPLMVNTLLTGGDPRLLVTVNAALNVYLDTTKSSVTNIGSNPYILQHNNSGAEPHDILTFGVTGTYVWTSGMFWGNIDAYTNYGGIMNTTVANQGAGGGSTGDRLLMYIR
jgi:hypothetical protein